MPDAYAVNKNFFVYTLHNPLRLTPSVYHVYYDDLLFIPLATFSHRFYCEPHCFATQRLSSCELTVVNSTKFAGCVFIAA